MVRNSSDQAVGEKANTDQIFIRRNGGPLIKRGYRVEELTVYRSTLQPPHPPAIPSLFHKLRAPAVGRNNGNVNRKNKNNSNGKNRCNGNRSSKSSHNRRDNHNRKCSSNRKGNSMAIVHVSFKSSSKAPPAAAHAQYIAREGQYHSRGGVELVESGNMPEFAREHPHAFWVAADAHERANGRTYTEIQIALPRELDPAQREELARETTRELLGDRFAYTMAVHVPLAKDNIDQPHMHLMFSERAVTEATREMPEELFFKRNGAKKDPEWNDRNKPEEVRERWVEMMNEAMQRAGIDQRLDPRSWVEQGREDLAALREEKTLRGDGPEAQERHEKIAEHRRQREDLPALHLDGSAATQELEKRAEAEVARIEQRRDEQISLLDKLIEKARELAVEVKERTTEFARNVVDRVESFFGAGKQENLPFTASLKEQEQARSPSPPTEEQLENSLAGLDQRIAMRESFDSQLAGLDKRMEAEARVLQEKELSRSQEISPTPPEKEVEIEHEHSRGFGIGW